MGIKIIHNNKKAYHNYNIGDKWEAGLVLQGTEVKSLRLGKANLSDGWVDIVNDEAILKDVHIGQYSHGNRENHEEKRWRKLLLHKKEIAKMERHTSEKGFSLVPLKIYFKDSRVKIEIGIGKGKKLHDKRESSKEKDSKRDIGRIMRNKN